MADWPRILHRGAVRTLAGVANTTTVLNWLRAEGLTGTKEGCAEGDCGACTVVLGTPDGERIRYRAVNSCILFVPALDGRELIVVEDLKAMEGRLHPVQQAMVDHHGSQCGFCTPGFVMSLFAHWHEEGEAADEEGIKDAFAGNLCRCTGYRPIFAAAVDALENRDRDSFDRDEPVRLARLAEIRRTAPLTMTDADGRHFIAPRSTAELAEVLMLHPNAQVLAGGTDVGLWVTKQHRRFDTIVYTGEVADMRLVADDGVALTIGGAASYTDALSALAEHFPDFAEMVRRLGSVQVRNSGTIGGNVANGSPIGDSMPPLIALGAEVILNRGGERRTLALEDLYLGYRETALQPSEFVEAVRVPLLADGTRFAAYKISKRLDQDISAVCAGFRLRLEGGAVAELRAGFGGVAAVPARARKTEAFLTGRPWTIETVEAAGTALAEDFQPISDMRSSAAYRARVAHNLLIKFHHETASSGARPIRVMPRKLAVHG